MKYNLEDFLNIIILKSQLVNMPEEKLLEEYQDKDRYGTFIDTANIMLDRDSGFLLLDESIARKIESVIASNRFKIKDEDYTTVANEVIIKINLACDYSKDLKEKVLESYRIYQEESRHISFDDDEELIEAIGYDAYVYDSIKNDNGVDLNTIYLYGSINYFKETIPEIYEDEEFRNNAIKKLEITLEKQKHQPFVGNRYIKKVLKTLQKTKTKKED